MDTIKNLWLSRMLYDALSRGLMLISARKLITERIFNYWLECDVILGRWLAIRLSCELAWERREIDGVQFRAGDRLRAGAFGGIFEYGHACETKSPFRKPTINHLADIFLSVLVKTHCSTRTTKGTYHVSLVGNIKPQLQIMKTRFRVCRVKKFRKLHQVREGGGGE